MATLQNQTPWVSGSTVPSSRQPSHEPTPKAASIIISPLSAEAAPAAWGKGPTAPLCPQGWCTPCATMNPQNGSSTAAGPTTPSQGNTPIRLPLASVNPAASPTVRDTLCRWSSRRHRWVPAR